MVKEQDIRYHNNGKSTTAEANGSQSLTDDMNHHEARKRHSHKKKHVDSWGLPKVDLDNVVQQDSADLEPAGLSSSYSKYILAPWTFFSFIISLTLVEWLNRRKRLQSSSSHSRNVTSSTWIARQWRYLHDLWDPEPYQDPDDTTWRTADPTAPDDATGQNVLAAGQQQQQQPYFARKKHRAMFRLQLGDALDMRHAVAVVLVSVFLIGSMTMMWGLRKVLGYLW